MCGSQTSCRSGSAPQTTLTFFSEGIQLEFLERPLSGTWTPQEADESINFLKMMAIHLALSHFSSRIRGQTILIRTDVSYLKCHGGTKVPRLTYLMWKLFHLCMDHNIHLVMVNLVGKLNTLGDQLSRATRPVVTEWALSSHVFRAITQKWHLRQPLPGPSVV